MRRSGMKKNHMGDCAIKQAKILKARQAVIDAAKKFHGLWHEVDAPTRPCMINLIRVTDRLIKLEGRGK